jgi:hypothetical protein
VRRLTTQSDHNRPCSRQQGVNAWIHICADCFGLYSLELGYQERFDNYSDFGSTEKSKVFFRWQPIDSSLTLRGLFDFLKPKQTPKLPRELVKHVQRNADEKLTAFLELEIAIRPASVELSLLRTRS